MACRFTFDDEQDGVILTTSDLNSQIESSPVKFGQDTLYTGKKIVINQKEYEINGFEIHYSVTMATDPESYRNHVGNYNPFNVDIIVHVKAI